MRKPQPVKLAIAGAPEVRSISAYQHPQSDARQNDQPPAMT
jgi:hypothetical protein